MSTMASSPVATLLTAARSSALPETSTGSPPVAPSSVEICYYRFILFSVSATFALGTEVSYAQVVPKLPQLYAMLLRAAVWDCVLVGVLMAQVIDLSSLPILEGTDGGHYLPVAVLLYHGIKIVVCVVFDLCSRSSSARGRGWHRSLVTRRILMELAGGTSGGKLLLGRVCFVVSGFSVGWLLRTGTWTLQWVDEGKLVFAAFIVMQHASYCAAGFAAFEPRRTQNSRRLVQWLCTDWGSRRAILQGPVKIVGALLLLPFAVSVILAQICLKPVALCVWFGLSCPCCRLQNENNVFDAFEREMALPLLQCSFMAFACTLSAIILGIGELTSLQRMIVAAFSTYYTLMLLLWATPAVLQEKVIVEETFEATLGDESQTQPLRGDRHCNGDNEVELEDVLSTCEELRALLYRERHDRSVEAAQLQDKLRDHELRVRSGERALQDAKAKLQESEEHTKELTAEINRWREKCNDLSVYAASNKNHRAQLPRIRANLVQEGKAIGGNKSAGSAESSSRMSCPPPPPGSPVLATSADPVSNTNSTPSARSNGSERQDGVLQPPSIGGHAHRDETLSDESAAAQTELASVKQDVGDVEEAVVEEARTDTASNGIGDDEQREEAEECTSSHPHESATAKNDERVHTSSLEMGLAEESEDSTAVESSAVHSATEAATKAAAPIGGGTSTDTDSEDADDSNRLLLLQCANSIDENQSSA